MAANDQVADFRTVRLHQALEDTRRLLIDHVDRTIGELQHALDYVSAGRSPLDSQLAEVALQELVGNDPEVPIRADTIMTVVGEFYGFTLDEIRGARGVNSLCRARHIAIHLCRELTDLSLPRIGREFDRDHTTAMHADRKIRHEITDDPRMRDQVQNLTVLIKRRAAVDVMHGARTGVPRRRVA